MLVQGLVVQLGTPSDADMVHVDMSGFDYGISLSSRFICIRRHPGSGGLGKRRKKNEEKTRSKDTGKTRERGS